jgi:hypothetical protein
MSMTIFEIIKKCVLVLLIVFNLIVGYIIYNIETKSECECVSSWKSKLLGILVLGILVFSIINLIVPSIISILVKLPLIGSLIIAIIIAMLGIQIYLINSITSDIKGCDTCSISYINKSYLNMLNGFSITVYAISIIIIGLTITLL